MLEEFLDRKHYHKLSKPIRGFNKFFVPDGEKENEMKWIREYENEELVGIAALQKEIRIERQKKNLLLLYEKPSSAPSDQKQKLENYERELLQARREYWLHQQTLTGLAREAPTGPWIREWKLQKDVKQKHGMTPGWWKEAKRCALAGGCCGRLCRCCEQPLRTYIEPSLEGVKTRQVYGHCSVECGCCTQSKGLLETSPTRLEVEAVIRDREIQRLGQRLRHF
jgi:hypothetical protein